MRRLIGILCCTLLAVTAACAGEDGRLPVPDKSDQRKALRELQKDMATRYKEKRNEERFVFARRLIRMGETPGSAPAKRWVYLEEAIRFATEVEDIRTVEDAATAISEGFGVDPLEYRQDALDDAAKKAHSIESWARLAYAYWTLAEDAITAEDFKRAASAARDAKKFANKTKDKGLIELTDNLDNSTDRLRDLYRDYLEAKEKIKSDPDNPKLAYAIGLYLVLARGDWENGLPFLARSDDELWKPLAAVDLSQPKEEKRKFQLGNQYWALSQEEWGRARETLQDRAIVWLHFARMYMDPPTLRKTTKQIQNHKLRKNLRHGLLVTWFEDSRFRRAVRSELQPLSIDENWGRRAPSIGIPDDEFSVWYTGYLWIDKTTEVTFYLNSDNGSRLFIDGMVVNDNWDAFRPSWSIGEKLEMEPGFYRMDLKMYEVDDSASLKLFWYRDKGKREPVPVTHLFHNRDMALGMGASRPTRIDRERQAEERRRRNRRPEVRPYGGPPDLTPSKIKIKVEQKGEVEPEQPTP